MLFQLINELTANQNDSESLIGLRECSGVCGDRSATLSGLR
jgi:hypothetical protein